MLIDPNDLHSPEPPLTKAPSAVERTEPNRAESRFFSYLMTQHRMRSTFNQTQTNTARQMKRLKKNAKVWEAIQRHERAEAVEVALSQVCATIEIPGHPHEL